MGASDEDLDLVYDRFILWPNFPGLLVEEDYSCCLKL